MFLTDGLFPVKLIVYLAYLEFQIKIANHKEEPGEIHKFCMEVHKTVVDNLKSILALHGHTKKTKFQLGFYCPGSFQADGQPHFCGCLPRQNYINPKSFYVQSLHGVKTSVVFLIHARSGLNIGRFVVPFK